MSAPPHIATVFGRVTEVFWKVREDDGTPIPGTSREFILEEAIIPADWPDDVPLRVSLRQTEERVAAEVGGFRRMPECGDTVVAQIRWDDGQDVNPVRFSAEAITCEIIPPYYH